MFEVDFQGLIIFVLSFGFGYLLAAQHEIEEKIERINQYLAERDDEK